MNTMSTNHIILNSLLIFIVVVAGVMAIIHLLPDASTAKLFPVAVIWGHLQPG